MTALRMIVMRSGHRGIVVFITALLVTGSVHRAMEIMGMRAAIRAGTEIQALAFQTAPSKEYMSRFRRDGKSVSDLLSERDSTFADYRERKSDG